MDIREVFLNTLKTDFLGKPSKMAMELGLKPQTISNIKSGQKVGKEVEAKLKNYLLSKNKDLQSKESAEEEIAELADRIAGLPDQNMRQRVIAAALRLTLGGNLVPVYRELVDAMQETKDN